jgi:hypothetical protein
MHPCALRFGLAATLVMGAPCAVPAQVTLTLSQTPNVFPAPALADYNAGMIVEPTGIAFTVDATGGAANETRTSTVSIRASSASLGGGKVLSDLEWRRSDLATWTSMTSADAAIESRPIRRNGTNDPWNNTVFLRMLLNWTTDAPATYSTGLVFTLTVTTP